MKFGKKLFDGNELSSSKFEKNKSIQKRNKLVKQTLEGTRANKGKKVPRIRTHPRKKAQKKAVHKANK